MMMSELMSINPSPPRARRRVVGSIPSRLYLTRTSTHYLYLHSFQTFIYTRKGFEVSPRLQCRRVYVDGQCEKFLQNRNDK